MAESEKTSSEKLGLSFGKFVSAITGICLAMGMKIQLNVSKIRAQHTDAPSFDD